jgi:hypothetical protein
MKKIPVLFIIVLMAGCKDKFEMPLRENDLSLLVVEGVLNAGQGPTTISLSRTVQVNAAKVFQPELKAKLTVEAKAGGNFDLSEAGNGNYTHSQLPLVIGQEYRLRIRTNDNREYLSDYVVARKTPDIDSVTWKRQNDGLTIYANTHDPSNNTKYYKWNFDETWEIRSFYAADYKWVSGTTIVFSPSYNHICWKYEKSTAITIGSTAQLSSDVVSEAPLQFIPLGSDKLSVRYSILLRQQSLTKEAYEFFKLMKSNTESLGSIFDPQPSELKGNITCISNPKEMVVGYLTASSIPEKRIFITSPEANWRYQQDCPPVTVPNLPDSLRLWVPGHLPFAVDKFDFFGVPASYLMSTASCVDCTKRGGDLNRPAFW